MKGSRSRFTFINVDRIGFKVIAQQEHCQMSAGQTQTVQDSVASLMSETFSSHFCQWQEADFRPLFSFTSVGLKCSQTSPTYLPHQPKPHKTMKFLPS